MSATKLQREPSNIASQLSNILIGQPQAIEAICPYVDRFNVGLSPEGRPAGVIMLLGPTGTGKTHTVQALADVLHGNPANLMRIDCGEFQMEHEVAKLIGAPPGYLGHKETQPVFTQYRINAASSEQCHLSLILFDEIEKAAPSMKRILLGILDRALVRLGDGNTVNFEQCLIFMTSNLGAKELGNALGLQVGFESHGIVTPEKMSRIGLAAAKRHFTPEFIGRVDEFVTYNQLTREDCSMILEHILFDLNDTIAQRLHLRGFTLNCKPAARERLLDLGTNLESGARDLKRLVDRSFFRRVISMILAKEIPPSSQVWLDVDGDAFSVSVKS